MTKISCFGKSELLCNNNQISLYMDVFSGMFIVKIHWFHLMEVWEVREEVEGERMASVETAQHTIKNHLGKFYQL